jgi:hypothetical protein
MLQNITELEQSWKNEHHFRRMAVILINKNNVIDVNKIIATIITQTPGAIFTSVSIEIDSVAVSTYTFVDGNIPHLNSVTYN